MGHTEGFRFCPSVAKAEVIIFRYKSKPYLLYYLLLVECLPVIYTNNNLPDDRRSCAQAIEFGVEHVPQRLFCHIHPCMMLNRKFVKVIRQIEHQLGSDKIYRSFLVKAIA